MELPALQPELGPLAERALVRRLTDERDHERLELSGDSLEPLARAGEVVSAQVAAPARRPRCRVRQAEAELEHRPLLARVEQSRREAGVREEAPEIISRVREVVPRSRGADAWIDPAKDDLQIRCEDVGEGGAQRDGEHTIRAVKVLVLGGTVFVGRHIVEMALSRDYEITLFNRGQHGAGLFPDVERLRGDRGGDLRALERRSWDAVIDTSGYFPRIVRASAELLADHVEHYTFVSSGSVYADVSVAGVDETAPVHKLPPEAPEELSSPEAYGGFKALSERAAEEAMRGRVLNVRAGLIVGPYDPTNRFTYWVTRIADGGEVLAPEPRDQPVQFVDARDLAAWILDLAADRRTGVYNAVGPERRITMEQLLEGMVEATGTGAHLVWMDEQFVLDQGVEAYEDLPLWLAPSANPDYAGFFAVDVSRALAAGLRFRPLAETVSDVLAWARSGETREPKDIGMTMPPAGLTREREAAILDAWRSRSLR